MPTDHTPEQVAAWTIALSSRSYDDGICSQTGYPDDDYLMERIQQVGFQHAEDVGRREQAEQRAEKAETELATLRAAVESARSAYEQSLGQCELVEDGAYSPAERHAARSLGERYGYGAMMSLLSALWHQKDPGGAFTVGHCYAILEADFRAIAAGGQGSAT